MHGAEPASESRRRDAGEAAPARTDGTTLTSKQSGPKAIRRDGLLRCGVTQPRPPPSQGLPLAGLLGCAASSLPRRRGRSATHAGPAAVFTARSCGAKARAVCGKRRRGPRRPRAHRHGPVARSWPRESRRPVHAQSKAHRFTQQRLADRRPRQHPHSASIQKRHRANGVSCDSVRLNQAPGFNSLPHDRSSPDPSRTAARQWTLHQAHRPRQLRYGRPVALRILARSTFSVCADRADVGDGAAHRFF